MFNRNNSFDLIRHLAALAVLISHHYVLSGMQEPNIQDFTSPGQLAVIFFFSISGFLITQSFVHSTSFYSYIKKRIARIFPALIGCSFIMVYIASSIFGKKNGWDYLLSIEALTDFLKISAFGRANIENITSSFIFSDSFNGSLWTLKIEFTFYIILALALRALPGVTMPLIMTLAFCITAYTASNSIHPLAPKLLIYSSVGIAFFFGSTLHYYKNIFSSKKTKISLCLFSMALIAITLKTEFSSIFSNIGFSLLILSIGTLYKDRIIKSKFDISYGMYLYAFPVQQLLINTTELCFYSSLFLSIILVIILATFSWLFIEKPALNFVHMKNRTKSNPLATL